MIKKIFKASAFSLVEMLMALLVASLLLAALAPVMTKKFGENVNVSGSGGSGVRSDYQRVFDKDTEWTVPGGVNTINITAVGGGGAGGGASYGYKEITSNESNWTVPDNVTKIRVFMTGAGGGGASGGYDKQTVNINGGRSEDNNTYKDFLTTGETSFTLTNRTVPALDNKCIQSGVTQWSKGTTTDTSASNTYTPNATIQTKVTACGAGGGSSGNGSPGGGSGGYLLNTAINPNSNTLVIKTGSPGQQSSGYGGGTRIGGAGGAGATPGSAGGNTAASGGSFNFWGTSGGGGSTGVLTGGTLIFEAPGGGGDGGSSHSWDTQTVITISNAGGRGGGSLNTNGGLGGGNPRLTSASILGGLGATGYGRGKDGSCVLSGGTSGYYVCGGGGGGGGIGGIGGGNGKLNSIFGTNYCEAGKPGALRLYYTYPPLKCDYMNKTNSGGGGGAGQVWIGEISVVPGQKLSFNIGMGGNGGNSNNTNVSGNNHDGKEGGSTSIYAGSTKLVSVSGGKGGKYETNNTYIANSGGYGGGIIISDADGIASGNLTNYSKTNNWTGIDINTIKSMAGLNGSQGNTIANGAGGGSGGSTIKRDGTVSLGAVSVNAETNGNNAISTNYGSGGSGGGGVVNYGGIKGVGGKGANGYIYIEWGNANGGGGSTGQVVTKKKVWVSAGTKIQIKVGKGGEAKPILTTLNGVSGYFGQQGNNGGDSYVITNEGEAIRAKGGIGGYPAGTHHGLGGNSEESVSSSLADKVIPNMIKGEGGNDDYGGIGGSITEVLCPLITELNGLGGCGGNMPSGHCANSSSTPIGKNAAKTGGGGGGGAVKIDSSGGAAYQGGKGADGMVVIEWNN